MQQGMKRFARVRPTLMEAGLAPAMDRGLPLWLGAMALSGGRISAALSSVVAEYPLTASLLRK